MVEDLTKLAQTPLPGMLSLPRDVCPAIAKASEELIARMKNALFYSGAGAETVELRSSIRKLQACLLDPPANIASLPRLLHSCERAANNLKLCLGNNSREACDQEIRSLSSELLSIVADSLLPLPTEQTQRRIKLLGAGSYNWALSDGKHVILVSKGLEADPSKGYELRRLGAKLMNQAGLNQPAVDTINAEPFPYMIMGLAIGKPLGAWMREEHSSKQRQAALSAFARFLRRCTGILAGHGQLTEDGGRVVCAHASKKAGLQWLVNRFSNPDDTGKMADQAITRGKLLPESAQARLLGYARLIVDFDEASMLANGDPNPANFLYEPATNHITALDLDMLRAACPSEFLGWLYQSWVLHELASENDYFYVLKEFEPDAAKQRMLFDHALSFAALVSYIHAADMIAKCLCSNPANPRETPERFLNFTRVALERKRAIERLR